MRCVHRRCDLCVACTGDVLQSRTAYRQLTSDVNGFVRISTIHFPQPSITPFLQTPQPTPHTHTRPRSHALPSPSLSFPSSNSTPPSLPPPPPPLHSGRRPPDRSATVDVGLNPVFKTHARPSPSPTAPFSSPTPLRAKRRADAEEAAGACGSLSAQLPACPLPHPLTALRSLQGACGGRRRRAARLQVRWPNDERLTVTVHM